MLRQLLLLPVFLLLFVSCDDDAQNNGSGGVCGNGVLEEGEECDGRVVGERSCADYGTKGLLRCSNTCQVDFSTCYEVVQTGTRLPDEGRDIVRDTEGNLYVIGTTEGELEGNSGLGGKDWLVLKISREGEVLWRLQGGSAADDEGSGITLSADESTLYIAGTTQAVDEQAFGGRDLFLGAINTSGTLLWEQRWGTEGDDLARDVACHPEGGVVVVGQSDGLSGQSGLEMQALLVQFDSNGEVGWSDSFGAQEEDNIQGITITEGGEIYLTGSVSGPVDGQIFKDGLDVFVARYSLQGQRRWIRLWGNYSLDYGSAVAVRDGTVYVVGSSDRGVEGDNSEKKWDVFLSAFDTEGQKLWTQQWGSKQSDFGSQVSFGEEGVLYVSGTTDGPINAAPVYGLDDLFLAKLNEQGELIWNHQWGTDNYEKAYGMVVADGIAHIVGSSQYRLDGETHLGYTDIVVLSVVAQ